jgi:hypothetical protein
VGGGGQQVQKLRWPVVALPGGSAQSDGGKPGPFIGVVAGPEQLVEYPAVELGGQQQRVVAVDVGHRRRHPFREVVVGQPLRVHGRADFGEHPAAGDDAVVATGDEHPNVVVPEAPNGFCGLAGRPCRQPPPCRQHGG